MAVHWPPGHHQSHAHRTATPRWRGFVRCRRRRRRRLRVTGAESARAHARALCSRDMRAVRAPSQIVVLIHAVISRTHARMKWHDNARVLRSVSLGVGHIHRAEICACLCATNGWHNLIYRLIFACDIVQICFQFLPDVCVRFSIN